MKYVCCLKRELNLKYRADIGAIEMLKKRFAIGGFQKNIYFVQIIWVRYCICQLKKRIFLCVILSLYGFVFYNNTEFEVGITLISSVETLIQCRKVGLITYANG